MGAKTLTKSKLAISKKKILIVDDHPLYREGLAEFINRENDIYVAGEAGSADQAFDAVKDIKPDLVVVDVTLKESSGIDLVKSLIARYPKLLMLVLSMHSDRLYADRAISAGAKGYANKETATKTIISAIRHILSGKVYLSEDMTQSLLQKKAGGISDDKSAVEALSDRELEVFNLIGNGNTTPEIAENLKLSSKTIETYRANIKNKLSLKNNTELIQHATKWVQWEST